MPASTFKIARAARCLMNSQRSSSVGRVLDSPQPNRLLGSSVAPPPVQKLRSVHSLRTAVLPSRNPCRNCRQLAELRTWGNRKCPGGAPVGWSTSLSAPYGIRDGLGSGGRCHPVDHTGDKRGWRRPEPSLTRSLPKVNLCARTVGRYGACTGNSGKWPDLSPKRGKGTRSQQSRSLRDALGLRTRRGLLLAPPHRLGMQRRAVVWQRAPSVGARGPVAPRAASTCEGESEGFSGPFERRLVECYHMGLLPSVGPVDGWLDSGRFGWSVACVQFCCIVRVGKSI